jgi:magnesium chelatase family protein
MIYTVLDPAKSMNAPSNPRSRGTAGSPRVRTPLPFREEETVLAGQRACLRKWNPSPGSGGFGDAERGRASQAAIRKYLNKISGPLLDRIDIHVEVPAVKHDTLIRPHAAESSADIRARVLKARALQHERFAAKRKVRCNAHMSSKDIKAHVPLDTDSESLLRMALTELNLSARAYDRILKVSRTIADLAGAEKVDSTHLSEAIQYRTLDRQVWG